MDGLPRAEIVEVPYRPKRSQGCSQRFCRKFLILRQNVCFLRVSFVHDLYTFYGQGESEIEHSKTLS